MRFIAIIVRIAFVLVFAAGRVGTGLLFARASIANRNNAIQIHCTIVLVRIIARNTGIVFALRSATGRQIREQSQFRYFQRTLVIARTRNGNACFANAFRVLAIVAGLALVFSRAQNGNTGRINALGMEFLTGKVIQAFVRARACHAFAIRAIADIMIRTRVLHAFVNCSAFIHSGSFHWLALLVNAFQVSGGQAIGVG
jgi:hypothetical protein